MQTLTPARWPAALLRLAATALLAASLAACGGSTPAAPTQAPEAPAPTDAPAAPTRAPAPTAAPAAGAATLTEAVFAKQLGENQEPIDPTTEFYPDETINLSLEFEGRPKQGVVAATFFWKDQEIAGAEVDMADANSGVIFSIGESTFVGFNLTHEKPLLISEGYRVETTLDGKELGTFEFAVVPPADAIPSQVIDSTLALGASDTYQPIDPTNEFAPEQEVFLVGSGNFGKGTWLQAEWYVDGKLDEQGTRSVGPLDENLEDGGFSFSFRPQGNWPVGTHEVALTLNDAEVGRYQFTVSDAPAATTGGETGASAGVVEIEGLESYTHESGLFTIQAPSNWEMNNSSEAGSINVTWQAPQGLGGLFVIIYSDATELDQDALSQLGGDFVTNVFGDDPDFEILATEPQADGSVLIAWGSSPEIGDESITITGLTYAEQRGDKVSLLTVVVPDDQYDELWESSLNTMVNSYRIDESVDVP